MKTKAIFRVKNENQLPNFYSAGFWTVHFVARLYAKCLVKRLKVGQWAVGAELPRRVRVGVDSQAKGFIAEFGSPNLPKGQKETLVGRKTVDFFVAFTLLRKCLEGFVSDRKPTNVGNVFA